MKATITKTGLSGKILIPASKSHTIRALIIASLAEGTSRIINPLDSSDTKACIKTCRLLGAKITIKSNTLLVEGIGGEITIPEKPIDVGNSGTTLYLAAGMAALGNREITFTGDNQIKARPVKPLLKSFNDLGAKAEAINGNGCAPIIIKGPLSGGKTSIECAASQYLSSLLICLPLAGGNTEITVPLLNEKPYVEMTLKWLEEQSVKIKNDNFKRFHIEGTHKYKSFTKAVPGDFSSAAFFLCAAAITGSKLILKGLDYTDAQGDKAVVGMLQKMGCEIDIGKNFIAIEGPTGGKTLKGADFDMNATPDALPALAVTACFAEGTTRLLNVPQARLKETDRIALMTQELKKMGGNVTELPDGLILKKSSLTGTEVNGHNDHRIVMALAIAGLASEGITIVDTAESAAVTFPGFFKLLAECTGQTFQTG